MNILITGGTGFLGAHLASQLIGPHKLYLLARNSNRDNLKKLGVRNVKLIRCDLTKRKGLKAAFPAGIDLVMHCAGEINLLANCRCPEGLAETNLTGTINLVEVMKDKSVGKLFFASSMTVYSPYNKVPVKESGLLEPVHFYGLTKKWAEEAILNYANHGFIRVLVFRYPGLYGYGRSSGYLYNIWTRLLKDEDAIINTAGLKFWEAMNIEDAAKITSRMLQAWDWSKKYAVFNCSYGEEVDFIKTAFKIKQLLGSKSRLKVNKPIGYIKFFLDNGKLKKMLKKFNYNFDKGLTEFLKKQNRLKNDVCYL